MVSAAIVQGRPSCCPSMFPTLNTDSSKFSDKYSSPKTSVQSARMSACARVLKMEISAWEISSCSPPCARMRSCWAASAQVKPTQVTSCPVSVRYASIILSNVGLLASSSPPHPAQTISVCPASAFCSGSWGSALPSPEEHAAQDMASARVNNSAVIFFIFLMFFSSFLDYFLMRHCRPHNS